MNTTIVTGIVTTDALSGRAGTSNMIVVQDIPEIRDVLSAQIISPHDSSNQIGIASASGIVPLISFGLSGRMVENLYPVPAGSLGSGAGASGQIAVCSGVTASGATVQIASCSAFAATTGIELGVDQMLVMKIATAGEMVRT